MGNNCCRPSNMSQLDYLWTHFGGLTVSNTPSCIPQDGILLTESGIVELLNKYSKGNIVNLKYRPNPLDDSQMQLIAIAQDGSEVVTINLPKEVYTQSFTHRKINQVDIDNGIEYPAGTEVLSILLTNGTEYLVSLEELGLVVTGSTTDTIDTQVTNGVIHSYIKIDRGNNELSVIKLKSTREGIYSDINLSESSEIILTKEKDGLSGKIPLGDSGYTVKFQQLTLSQYMNLQEKDYGTVYFITDKAYIFLGEYRYGIDVKPGQVPIISLVYDADHMLLSYKKADGSDIQQIHLGPATRVTPGMLSTEDYSRFEDAYNSLQWRNIYE